MSTLPSPRSRVFLAICAVVALALMATGAIAQTTTSQSLDGWLDIVFGDGPQGSATSPTLFTLTLPDGKVVLLDLGDPLVQPIESLLAMRGDLVRVDGQWTSAGEASGRFQVSTIQSAKPGESPAIEAVVGSKPWVSILCKFADVSAEPKAPGYFSDMYSSAYPGMDHYWREESYDLMNVLGSAATAQWFVLPQPRSYYVYDMNGDGTVDFDHNRATADCTQVADAAVNYASYVGINMMFNDLLDCCAWGGSRTMTLDGTTKTWYTTWEPPWGYEDITVIAHEMGHGFGFPHSSGAYGQTYDNQWDVMSDTWTNCGNLSHPVYGCLGQHTITYHKNLDGWIGSRRVVVPSYSQATVTLEQLALPQTTNYLMAQIPINGSTSRYYTVEVRRKVGYDVKLPGQAVIIHSVDTSRTRPAYVVDIDNNGNTGDAGAQWLVGETFTDTANNITVRVDSTTSTGFVVTICNACGQPTPTATATPTFTPSPTPRPTATPTATPVLVHIGDLDGSRTISGKKWTARVTITVHDGTHGLVAGATVTGSWSNGASGSASCTTASNGTCTVSKANISTNTGSVTFGVTGISKAGTVYSPTANHDPETDSNGTIIVVTK